MTVIITITYTATLRLLLLTVGPYHYHSILNESVFADPELQLMGQARGVPNFNERWQLEFM